MKTIRFLSFPIILISLMSVASAGNKYYEKYRYGMVSPLVGENSTIAVVRPDSF